MKALSIRQPWAGLIAAGSKTIETRSRRTYYRGEFLVCASLTKDEPGLNYVFEKHRRALEHAAGRYERKNAPLFAPKKENIIWNIFGVAIAVAHVVDCRPMSPRDENGALCPFSPSLFSWVLGDVRKIKPFPVSGKLGFFNVE